MGISVVIIIPIYKAKNLLQWFEETSLKQCINVLSSHRICLVCPKSFNVDDYLNAFTKINFLIERFDNEYFLDIQGYNALMLNKEFYKRFLGFEFMLIYQLDAFVFKDELIYWCRKGYDYIGAPWLTDRKYNNALKQKWKEYIWTRAYKKNKLDRHTRLPVQEQFNNKVGNGGFSLRRIKKMFEVLTQYPNLTEHYLGKTIHPHFNEDVFWSLEVNRTRPLLNIPDYIIAVHFSIETWPEIAFEMTNRELPFGCHDWDKYYDFWKDRFVELGIENSL